MAIRRCLKTFCTCPRRVVATSCEDSYESNFDCWSLSHIFWGAVYSIPLFLWDKDLYSFLIALGCAVLYEFVENSEFGVWVAAQFCRTENYRGDNFWNSMCDILCCMVGFLIVFGIREYTTLASLGSHSSLGSHNRHLATVGSLSGSLFDWRDLGAVSDVYTQNSCNSCWAITAAEHLDAWNYRLTGNFGISAQQLMDCTPATLGCTGGLMDHVFAWGGPWNVHAPNLSVSHQEVCIPDVSGLHVEEFVALEMDVETNVEEYLAKAVQEFGPVPVAIDSSGTKFRQYKSGVLRSEDCNKEPNHAVLVVGFTPRYWIVKNSWGVDWGKDGYGYVERGKNVCGIGSYASWVTKVKYI